MSSEESRMSVFSIRRFPTEIREQLNKLLERSSWQFLKKKFNIHILTGLRAEALDNIADFVDSDYPEFKDYVKKKLAILKVTAQGKTESFEGKCEVAGFHSSFYRVWLVGRRNADGLCDVVFCQICRKEEFDFWFCLKKIFNGCIYALAPAPQAIDDLGKGVSQDEEKKPPGATQGSPYSDPNQDLADRLVEHELVEDLIGRGILENGDGTMSIRLQ